MFGSVYLYFLHPIPLHLPGEHFLLTSSLLGIFRDLLAKGFYSWGCQMCINAGAFSFFLLFFFLAHMHGGTSNSEFYMIIKLWTMLKPTIYKRFACLRNFAAFTKPDITNCCLIKKLLATIYKYSSDNLS